MTSDTQITTQYKPSLMHWGYGVLLGGLALIGFAVCWHLLTGYDVTKTSSILTNEWFCGTHDALNYGCSGVFASRFGKPGGIPMPVFGVVYFAFVFLWIVIFRQKTLNFLFALVMAGGVLTSCSLLFILFFVLPGQCRWCLLVHLTNAAMIVTAIIAFVRTGGFLDISDFEHKLSRAGLALFIVLALLGWAMVLVFRTSTQTMVAEYEKIRLSDFYQRSLYMAQKVMILPIQSDDHVLGDRSAGVTIIAYKDYQCNHCQKAWKILRELYDRMNAGKQNNLCIVVRHYPLSYQCNPAVKTDIHPFACPAAQASEAAFLTGGDQAFWKYNDLLIKNHDNLDDAPYLQLAREIGISEKSFLTALKDPRIKTKIQKDAASMSVLQIPQILPTIFINGKRFDGWPKSELMEQLVREQLKTKTTIN
ncbi:MAG: thioredoxin domain-containing protein [Phycisphaerae bacterium]